MHVYWCMIVLMFDCCYVVCMLLIVDISMSISMITMFISVIRILVTVVFC